MEKRINGLSIEEAFKVLNDKKVMNEAVSNDEEHEDFIENGKQLNNNLSFENRDQEPMSYEKYLDYFDDDDITNHEDWIQEFYGDYKNLIES